MRLGIACQLNDYGTTTHSLGTAASPICTPTTKPAGPGVIATKTKAFCVENHCHRLFCRNSNCSCLLQLNSFRPQSKLPLTGYRRWRHRRRIHRRDRVCMCYLNLLGTVAAAVVTVAADASSNKHASAVRGQYAQRAVSDIDSICSQKRDTTAQHRIETRMFFNTITAAHNHVEDCT